MSTSTLPDRVESARTEPERMGRRSGAFRRWRRRVLVLGLAVAAVWLAPALVAHSPVRHRILPWLFPEYRGRIVTGGASLGWLMPVMLRDVEAFSPADDRLLRVASIRSEKSLLALLTDRPRTGHFYLAEPELTIRLRPDGSNLEDAVAAMGSAGGDPLEYTLEITGGRVQVIDTVSSQQARLETMTATVHQPLTAAEPFRVTVTGLIDNVDPTSGRGRFSMELSLPAISTDAGSTATARAALTIENLRLAPLASLLARRTVVPPGSAGVPPALSAAGTAALRPKDNTTRQTPDVQLDGAVSCRIESDWNVRQPASTLTASGTLSIRELNLHAPPWLGADTLRADRAELTGRVALTNGAVRCEGIQFQSDLGQCHVSGTIALPDAGRLSGPEWWRRFLENDLRCHGTVPLARLTATLPGTLRIRDDVRFTAGTATWSFVSEPTDEGRHWQAELETSGIEAVRHDQPIRWEQPLIVSLSARRSPQGVSVDRFACRSDFLQLAGQAGEGTVRVSGEGDLSRLTAELGQVLDLGGWQLRGTVKLATNVTLSADEIAFRDATINAQSLDIRGPAIHLREPWVRIETAGAWNRRTGRLTTERSTWASPSLSLRADDLSLAWTDGGLPELAGAVVFRGGLGEVLDWFPTPPTGRAGRVAGVMAGQGRFSHSAAGSAIDGKLTVTDFVVRQAGPDEPVVWAEPRITLDGRIVYAAAGDRLDIDRLQLVSKAGQLEARGCLTDLTGRGTADLRGEMTADPAQLTALCRNGLKYVAPMLADATQIDGRLSASVVRCDLPLDAPTAGNVQGQLDIHGAQVRPGPLMLPVLQLGRRIQSLVERRPLGPVDDKVLVMLPEQRVTLQMSGGRVQHGTMEFVIGDLILRTHGSVGFDETLDLIAEIPIRDQWLAGNRSLAGLRGTQLRIPIRGTASQPQIDARAVTDLARQLATQAGGRLIEDELRRQLDRLLPRRP